MEWDHYIDFHVSCVEQLCCAPITTFRLVDWILPPLAIKGELVPKKLPQQEVNTGEAHAALLAVNLAASAKSKPIHLERDSLVATSTINNHSLTTKLQMVADVIQETHHKLQLFSNWTHKKLVDVPILKHS